MAYNARETHRNLQIRYFCSTFVSAFRETLDVWSRERDGTIAQLVEQRTENPCVTGSNPVGTTKNDLHGSFFCTGKRDFFENSR